MSAFTNDAAKIEAGFKGACEFVKVAKSKTGSKADNTRLLKTYALYKQAMKGDVEGSQPWAIQLEARAKWDAWAELKGMSQIDAKKKYAEEIKEQISLLDLHVEGGFHWPEKKVLIVLTSVDKYPDGSPTGWYLPEAVHPYWVFQGANMNVEFASIKGGAAPVDPSSLDMNDAENKKFWEDASLKALTENTKKLDDVNAFDYDAVLFAGGFGTMWDFPESEVAQNLVKSMYEDGKVVAAVCHGPCVFANVKLSNGDYLLKGKECTAFSNIEEDQAQKRDVVPFTCEDKIKEREGVYKSADAWNPCVAVAGNLLSGQNPQSAKPLAEAMVKAM